MVTEFVDQQRINLARNPILKPVGTQESNIEHEVTGPATTASICGKRRNLVVVADSHIEISGEQLPGEGLRVIDNRPHSIRLFPQWEKLFRRSIRVIRIGLGTRRHFPRWQEQVDSKAIKKHKNDVFRLYQIIDPDVDPAAPGGIKDDLRALVERLNFGARRVDLGATWSFILHWMAGDRSHLR
jgi:hypothetical protein